MGFLDKAKSVLSETVGDLNRTFDPAGSATSDAEAYFRDLGALEWARQRGAQPEDYEAQRERLFAQLSDVELASSTALSTTSYTRW